LLSFVPRNTIANAAPRKLFVIRDLQKNIEERERERERDCIAVVMM